MTFELCTLNSVTRKPAPNAVAASRSQTGQRVRPGAARPVMPIQRPRPIRYTNGGYASGALAKMCPRLKNQSETENEGSAIRSRFRSENGRRQSKSPIRNAAQNESQTE